MLLRRAIRHRAGLYEKIIGVFREMENKMKATMRFMVWHVGFKVFSVEFWVWGMYLPHYVLGLGESIT